MDVTELIDRHQITALMTAYTRAVDTSSWDDLDCVFAADAVLDYSAPGGPVGPLTEAKAFIRNLEGFTRWQHMLGQFDITLEPGADTASGVTYFFNPMIATRADGTEQLWEVGGYYHFDAVRTSDGWRLSKLVDDIVWTRVQP
ncbi:nuclear transport factor 2 family protein [Gordonia malaquae]|uniref:nuclear transport factor 2 family protein n=1 Tax=Gordonia malaquae TaxID=410332 RepID=UPI0030FE9C24